MSRYTIILAFLFFIVSACHSSDDEVPVDSRLVKSWLVEKVSLDRTDVTAYFSGLELTLTSSGSYRVQNPVPPVWSPNGTYTVNDGVIRREDDVAIQILELSETQLVLEFQYDAAALGGRTNHVSGTYQFEFSAN